MDCARMRETTRRRKWRGPRATDARTAPFRDQVIENVPVQCRGCDIERGCRLADGAVPRHCIDIDEKARRSQALPTDRARAGLVFARGFCIANLLRLCRAPPRRPPTRPKAGAAKMLTASVSAFLLVQPKIALASRAH
jgi:hypothetical protein